MNKVIYSFSVVLLLTFTLSSCSKPLTGEQLLDNAITYHDPNGNWSLFNASFTVRMETPDQPGRDSKITIDLANEVFNLVVSKDSMTTRYSLHKEDCIVA